MERKQSQLIDPEDATSANESASVRQNPLHPNEETELPAIDIAAAVALLQSWSREDPKEQQEDWQFLRAALDEDRFSDRKLFS